tara:strand:+ start:297 stop:626 length:330 start_codon:yes stop_codon:yes gene_type:complete
MTSPTSKWFKYLTESNILCEECGGMHEGACPMSDNSTEHDDEGLMAKRQLYKIMNYAKEIHDNLGDDDQLEAWVQSKIATMSSMMGAVKHYLEYEYKKDMQGLIKENND